MICDLKNDNQEEKVLFVMRAYICAIRISVVFSIAVSICFISFLDAKNRSVRRVENEILSVRVDKPAKNVWIAFNGKQEKQYKDHFPYGSFADSAEGLSAIEYSPDRRHVAMEINDDGKHFVIVDGKRGKSYGCIKDITFSPDSAHLSYIAGIDKKYMMIVDGKAGNPYDEIDRGSFSPDSKHIAYSAKRSGKSFIVADEKERKRYGCLCGPAFSPDSKHVFYLVSVAKKQFIVIDEKEGKLYDEVSLPLFSPDGQHYAYKVKEAKKSFIVTDGKEMKRYDRVDNIAVSPDNIQIAYIALEGWKWFVVINGVEGKHYFQYGKTHTTEDLNFGVDSEGIEDIEKIGPVFSPDGSHLAYVANEGMKRFVVIDGKEQKQYDYVSNITFSPNSKRIAYAAIQDRNHFAVIDGKESDMHSTDSQCAEELHFSPDSKHAAYLCSEFFKQSPIVFDGIQLKEEYIIIRSSGRYASKSIIFDSPNTFHYLAVKYLYRDQYEIAYKIYLVEQHI